MQAVETIKRSSNGMGMARSLHQTSNEQYASKEDLSAEEDELSEQDLPSTSTRNLDVESIVGRQGSKRRRLSKQTPRSAFNSGKPDLRDETDPSARLQEGPSSNGTNRKPSGEVGRDHRAGTGPADRTAMIDSRSARDSELHRYRPNKHSLSKPISALTAEAMEIERRTLLSEQKSPPDAARRSSNGSGSPPDKADRNGRLDGNSQRNDPTSIHSTPQDGSQSPTRPLLTNIRPRTEVDSSKMPPPNPRTGAQVSPPQKRTSPPTLRWEEAGSSRSKPETIPATYKEDLSPDEVDIFLDLIIRHNPETMTPENMTMSVNALYDDWLTLCATRSIVAKPKKALMDEYGKIYNGKYGPVAQHRARLIAQEGTKPAQQPPRPSLSRRGSAIQVDLTTSDGGEIQSQSESSLGGQPSQQPIRTDANRRSGQESDRGSDSGRQASASRRGSAALSTGRPLDDGASRKCQITGEDLLAAVAGRKKRDGSEGTPVDDAASNIAQIGRNGLAVLPPGLFDILSNHLKDEILDGIMPLIRTDLKDQTRDLALQNQDLVSRLRALEDQVRNQDLWLRQLLFRDQSDWTSQTHVRDPLKKDGRLEQQQAAFPQEIEFARGDGVGYRDQASGPASLISPAPRQRWRGMSPPTEAAPPPPPPRSSGPHISSRTPPPRGAEGRIYYRVYPSPQTLPPPDYGNGGIRSAPPMREWRASLGFSADFAPPPPPQLGNKPPSPPLNRRVAPPYQQP